MPPRRKKALKKRKDDEEDEETEEKVTGPVKSSQQGVKSQITKDAKKDYRSRKSKSELVDAACDLSPARKLRKQLDQVDSAVGGCQINLKNQEVRSKYFGGEIIANVEDSRSQKTTDRRGKKPSQKKRAAATITKAQAPSENEKLQKRTGNRTRRRESELCKEAKSTAVKQVEREEDRTEEMESKHTSRSHSAVPEINAGTRKTRKLKESTSQSRTKTGSAAPNKGNRRKGGREEKDKGRVQAKRSQVESKSSSDSESEWEEVEELEDVQDEDSWKSQIPEKSVQITLEGSDILTKRRKKGSFDVQEYFRLQLNRFRTATQENAHKVHLLCLLSHGQFKNFICKSLLLKSIALSLVPWEFLDRPQEKWTLHLLTRFTSWFKKTITLEEGKEAEVGVSEEVNARLLSAFSERKAKSEHDFILMFTISSRSVGLLTRLIYSLQPITFKPSDLKKNKLVKNPSSTSLKTDVKTKNSLQKTKGKNPEGAVIQSSQKQGHATSFVSLNDSSVVSDDNSQSDASRLFTAESSSGSQSLLNTEDKDESKLLPQPIADNLLVQRQKLRSSRSKVNYNEGESNTDLESSDDERKEDSLSSNTEADCVSGKLSKRKRSSSDDDFEDSKVAFRRQGSKKQKKPARKKTSSVLEISDEDRFVIVSKSFGSDWWTEVYLEDENKWICINGSELVINRPEAAEQHAVKPISFVLAYDNDGCIKDITKKYLSDWMSSVKKVRVDEPWWQKVLAPFQKHDSERDAKEDAEVQEQLLKKPLPTSISGFKNHQLYALKRQLLKYEAIYPPTAPVLGYIRGEPVYPRECVHCLHSKEKWRLEGRLIRIGELPYKTVKARPKWNKPKAFNDQLKLPLFGQWQTEVFIPVPAVAGKVPKNEYGNVEVFKPWMLPGGTVHLPETMSGLGKIAKKLDVDVAPAMVGWEFHNGFNHPILQGWIVCEEHKDILMAAWEEDQAIQLQKEAEKKQQRVLNNWKILIKGLLIRERLKKRFDLQEPTEVRKKNQGSDLNDEDSDSNTEAMPSSALFWPENLKIKEGNTNFDTKDNLFPFEKKPHSSTRD